MLGKLVTDLLQEYSHNLAILQELSRMTKDFEMTLETSEQDHEWDNDKILADFVDRRTELFLRLKMGSERVFELQKEICRLADISSFELNALKARLSQGQYEQGSVLTSALLHELSIVLELDSVILPRIEQELQGVKGELYRLQGAKVTKNAYQNQASREARFIDKNK